MSDSLQRFFSAAVLTLSFALVVCLILMSLPQQRQMAQRTTCADRMRIVALGIHNYHDAFNSLPPSCGGSTGSFDGNPEKSNQGRLSGFAAILPFVEHQPAWEELIGVTDGFPSMGPSPAMDPNRYKLWRTQIDAFLCPAESSTQRDYGIRSANRRLKVPASPSTVYGTGSCLKPVTAMAVMQLVDKGLVQLDDPVNKHLGEYAIDDMSDEGKPVTIRHLLSHHSGLSITTGRLPVWGRELPKTLEELAADLKPVSPPGVKYEYSNSGYALAGLLIEQVTGQSYEQYLVDHLLKPVGCEVTALINPSPQMLEVLAQPYRLENRIAQPQAPQRFDIYPAGDAYISVPNMAKVLLTQLNDGKSQGKQILSPESIQEMRTRQFGGKDGLDFGVVETEGDTLIVHGGRVPGWSTKFILATESKTGVYVAANAHGLLALDTIAQMAIDLLRGKEIGKGLIQKIVHVGIGFREDKESGLLRIGVVFPNSPASRAGLSEGLLIRKIDETEVKGKPFHECLKLMNGPQGTEFQFEIFEAGKGQTQTVGLKKQTFLAPS